MITMQHVWGYRANRGGVGLLQVCADGSKAKPLYHKSQCRVATCIRDGWPAQFTNAGPEYYFSTPLLCALLNQHITDLFYYTVHCDTHTIQGCSSWLLNSHTYLPLTRGMHGKVPVSVKFCHLATYILGQAHAFTVHCTVIL